MLGKISNITKNKDKDLPPRENVDNLFPDEVNAEDKANI